MVFGRIIFSLFSCWMMVIKQVLILNPWYLFKVAFLWFFLAFSVTYLFFLLCHVKNMVHVRQDLAVELTFSMSKGFLLSTAILGLYEFILSTLARSEFFKAQQSMIKSLTLINSSDMALYKSLSFMVVSLSAVFAYRSVSQLLSNWCQKAVFNRYGLCIMMISLICWGFLWFLAYV